MTRRPLCCLQRDITGKALGDYDIDGAAADIVAFDEAVIFDPLDVGLTDQAPGSLLFLALISSTQTFRRPTGRTLYFEERRANCARHQANP